jgi:hypothetical protein
MYVCYRGLVLQDLTFVHIGNTDLLPDGSVNFSKRWQQFNIVENMKRFKKGQVPHYCNLHVEEHCLYLGNMHCHSVQDIFSLKNMELKCVVVKLLPR